MWHNKMAAVTVKISASWQYLLMFCQGPLSDEYCAVILPRLELLPALMFVNATVSLTSVVSLNICNGRPRGTPLRHNKISWQLPIFSENRKNVVCIKPGRLGFSRSWRQAVRVGRGSPARTSFVGPDAFYCFKSGLGGPEAKILQGIKTYEIGGGGWFVLTVFLWKVPPAWLGPAVL